MPTEGTMFIKGRRGETFRPAKANDTSSNNNRNIMEYKTKSVLCQPFIPYMTSSLQKSTFLKDKPNE